ncbi:HlyU family transcriptional regulator [Labrenzia sp. PHM005]|uniref:HlyU family transcriptional regulator n=1 Tax=Stappiaceae TaxID=2821832 RepID=UPI0011404BA0|nr:HlyU family transcriptional regulator [Labrenzia sp. PHM005]QDG76491.1 transcriptional regulator [Labrenzia sp. PHM005]
MFGKVLKSLFGTSEGGQKTGSSVSVDYDSYTIIAEPQQSGGQWQVRGRIEKQVGEDLKSHVFIRADTLPGESEAANEMIRKAKLMIDQQGDTIFK